MWYPALASGVDVIVFQETHLTVKQERAFNCCAQAFDNFYAHGTSQLGGMMVAIRRSSNMKPKLISQEAGHKISLDLTLQGDALHFIALYAPVEGKDLMNFFDKMTPDIVPGCTIVVGDFNSVTEAED